MSYPPKFRKYHGWLPSNPDIHNAFLAERAALATAAKNRGDKHSVPVQDFANVIQNDPVMKDLFDQAFLQASEKNTVTDFEVLLYALDAIIKFAPSYYVVKDKQGNPFGELVGMPMFLMFDLLSNTSAAYDLFRLPKFNTELQKLLNIWGKFLQSSGSNVVLNKSETGWFSDPAIQTLSKELHPLTFDQTFVTTTAPDRGFETWDAFFTRQLRKDVRPLHALENKSLIHSPCESTVYRIAYHVKVHDQFWLKEQKYSLSNMLLKEDKITKKMVTDDEMVKYFKGGTVYQAFLSPFDFHRWHSPIDGIIEKVVMVPGTYYAILPDEGAPIGDPDLPPGSPYGALIRSQAFLTVYATRVLFYIKADNPDIGTVCFIAVGMAEISTCDVTVGEGKHVSTGDEIGMFHFGGSTAALIFRPDCNIAFASEASVGKHVWINSIIGQVVPK